MAEFIDRYGSDEKCEAALIESCWPSGFACPACGSGHSQLKPMRAAPALGSRTPP